MTRRPVLDEPALGEIVRLEPEPVVMTRVPRELVVERVGVPPIVRELEPPRDEVDTRGTDTPREGDGRDTLGRDTLGRDTLGRDTLGREAPRLTLPREELPRLELPRDELAPREELPCPRWAQASGLQATRAARVKVRTAAVRWIFMVEVPVRVACHESRKKGAIRFSLPHSGPPRARGGARALRALFAHPGVHPRGHSMGPRTATGAGAGSPGRSLRSPDRGRSGPGLGPAEPRRAPRGGAPSRWRRARSPRGRRP